MPPAHHDTLGAQVSSLRSIVDTGELTRRTNDAPPGHIGRAGYERPADGTSGAAAPDGELCHVGV